MSKDYAVMHVGIGSKRYKPGDELPPLTDEQWKRLSEIGAIRSEHDPVELELTLADDMAREEGFLQGDEPESKPGDETTGEAEDKEASEEGETQEAMPDINVMDGIDEAEEEKPKKRGRKAGRA